MCEGKLKLDAQGNQLFEPTDFKTSDGDPVEKPQCDMYPDWAKNNTESYDVRLPDRAESYVTGTCRDGLFGPLRNCGWRQKTGIESCTPGKKVTVTCTAPTARAPQVVRVCEASRALQIGLPCTYNDALASATIGASKQDITFTCPAARDDTETGGIYSFLTGPLLPQEEASEVTCVTKQ